MESFHCEGHLAQDLRDTYPLVSPHAFEANKKPELRRVTRIRKIV